MTWKKRKEVCHVLEKMLVWECCWTTSAGRIKSFCHPFFGTLKVLTDFVGYVLVRGFFLIRLKKLKTVVDVFFMNFQPSPNLVTYLVSFIGSINGNTFFQIKCTSCKVKIQSNHEEPSKVVNHLFHKSCRFTARRHAKPFYLTCSCHILWLIHDPV